MHATPVYVNVAPERPLVFRVELRVFVDANPYQGETCAMQTARAAVQDAPTVPIHRELIPVTIYTQYSKKSLASQLDAISGDAHGSGERHEDFSEELLADCRKVVDTHVVTSDRRSMQTTPHSTSIGTRDAYAPRRDTLSRKAPGADARAVKTSPGKCDPHADDSSRRKPPVGLEPTTCGLQNLGSAALQAARFARLEDVADMLNAIARVLKGAPDGPR